MNRSTKIRRLRLWTLTALVLLGVVGHICLRAALAIGWLDFVIAGAPDVSSVRTKAFDVADRYVETHLPQLRKEFGSEIRVERDESQRRALEDQGYDSCFYYYCWVLYFPYKVSLPSGQSHTLVLKLSDSVEGQQHDLEQMRVTQHFVLEE